MYDIKFIKNSEYLKEAIASGELNRLYIGEVFQKFKKLRSKKPYIFNLETTNYCNMECKMCPRTRKMSRPVQWLDKRHYSKVLDQIIPYPEGELEEFFGYIQNKYGIRQDEQSENAFYFYIASRCITLHGFGEPILDPHITDVIRMCNERNIPTYFSCVPANINLRKIRELMQAGLAAIKFSMDALGDERMREIRGKKSDFSNSFKKILGVLNLKERYPEYKTKVICTMISLSASSKQREMEKEFLKLWSDYGVYAYIKSQNDRWLYKQDDELGPVSISTKEYCEYPWTSLTVMADGSVVPCTQDYDCEMVMGNIKEQTLEDIWNSERYQHFRKMHIRGDFPPGFKCVDRCDQILVSDRLKGKPRTLRVI